MRKAGNRLQDAATHEKQSRHAESVQAAQESIELYAKAVYLLVGQPYPTKHKFTEEEFIEVIEQLPESVRYLNFPRLYLLHRFWAAFYGTAKYGFEALGAPPDGLFQYREAQLAVGHGREWQNAALRLKHHLDS
jgi:HEPN domain-containing protein